MKTYTHPTINLPCGAVVVKFYDDSLADASENTADIIEEIGDVTEGFDINLGELIVPECEFVLHNKDNYVLGTLLANGTLRVSVTIDGEYYFYGDVDFESIDPEVFEISSTNKLGRIRFNCVHVFSRAQQYTLKQMYDNVASIVDPDSSGYMYLRQFFRQISEQCKLDWTSFASSHVLELHRIFKYDVGGGSYDEYNLDQVIIKKDYLNYKGSYAYNNFYLGNVDNLFDVLTLLSKDFFFYPSLVYQSSVFKLKIREKDYEQTITTGSVKSSRPYRKYVISKLISKLDKIPITIISTDLYFSDVDTYPHLGDVFENNFLHTTENIGDGCTTVSGGTLSTTPIDIEVNDNIQESGPGEAVITSGATPQTFSYNGKTSTHFTGCVIDSGTFGFNAGDTITDPDGYLVTNMLIYIKENGTTAGHEIDLVENFFPSEIEYNGNIEAVHEGYKNIYHGNKDWRELLVHGLKGTRTGVGTSHHYLMPTYRFSYLSETHYIHQVTKSIMRNESRLVCLVIS